MIDKTTRYQKGEPGYMPTMYGGNLVENLVQTAAAELALEAATAGMTPDGDGPLSDSFTGGGGDFSGGGASGSW